jgi:uncharacterized protein (UPF0218 family)
MKEENWKRQWAASFDKKTNIDSTMKDLTKAITAAVEEGKKMRIVVEEEEKK